VTYQFYLTLFWQSRMEYQFKFWDSAKDMTLNVGLCLQKKHHKNKKHRVDKDTHKHQVCYVTILHYMMASFSLLTSLKCLIQFVWLVLITRRSAVAKSRMMLRVIEHVGK